MAYQVGSACYPTAQAAAQASASAQVGAVVVHGGSAYVVDVGGISGTSITYNLQPAAGGGSIQITASYMAQPCSLLQIGDGLQMGWMVAGAWIATYALMFVARALRGEESQNGDA